MALLAVSYTHLDVYKRQAIPVGADSKDIGETDLPVNFGGVTFLPDDHLYADTTGVILSPDALDIE